MAKKMKLAEIAERIYAHLKRIEADPVANQKNEYGLHLYWNVNVYAGGSRIFVTYISYQGSCSLTREEAERYLAWLDVGNIGKHWEANGFSYCNVNTLAEGSI